MYNYGVCRSSRCYIYVWMIRSEAKTWVSKCSDPISSSYYIEMCGNRSPFHDHLISFRRLLFIFRHIDTGQPIIKSPLCMILVHLFISENIVWQPKFEYKSYGNNFLEVGWLSLKAITTPSYRKKCGKRIFRQIKIFGRRS